MKTQINLLPSELQSKYEKKRVKKLLAFPLIIFIILFIIFSFLISDKIQHYKEKLETCKNELDTVKQQYANLEDKLKYIEEIKDKISSKKEYFELVDELIGKKIILSDLFVEISLSIPKDAWLEKIEFGSLNSSFLIEGQAFSNTLVHEFLYDLQESSYFSKIRLIRSEEIDFEGRSLTAFKIKSTVK